MEDQVTELPWANMYSLLLQDIPPEQPSQQSTDDKRKRFIVRGDRERINGCVSFF